MTTFAILGFGSRGMLFAGYIVARKDARLDAVCDILPQQLDRAQTEFGVKKERCFPTADAFFAQGKLADALILSTQDRDHYAQAMKALELGYDILLEKPAATTAEHCKAIRDEAHKRGRKVMLCHVLRYAHFYRYVKKIIDSGKIGKVVTVNQTENVGYWHYSHSFVRGAWRNSGESSPMILAKCCHDLDILSYLTGSDLARVSSFGSLAYFKKENAPKGSTPYCVDCAVKNTCPYNCFKIYRDRDWMIMGNLSQFDISDPQKIDERLGDRQCAFGRCVFACDNNVVDHQVVNLDYLNGATAHLTMTGFTEQCTRTLHVHGTLGEIIGDMEEKKLTVNIFGFEREEIDLTKLNLSFHCHGGGDEMLLSDFIAYVSGEGETDALTTIDKSIESHLAAFSAEESRLNCGKVIEL